MKNTFYIKKENTSLYSESTKPEIYKKMIGNITKLSLDEFADFNEHSLDDSYSS